MWSRICLVLAALLCVTIPAWAQNTNKADYQEQFLQSAAVAVGNGTVLPVDRYTSVGLDVSIATTATITFEGSVEGSSAYSVVCTNTATGVPATTATVSGTYQCNVAGLKGFRARISSWTAGAVTVYARATTAIIGGSSGGGAGGSTPTLSGCWATVAAPTYSEGILNAISCTLTGAIRFTLDTLLFGEDYLNNLLMTSGGLVRQTTIMTGVTTNTTSLAVDGYTGPKSVRGEVAGTGAVTATITIFCDDDSDAANGDLLGTLTLSGTTLAKDRLPVITAPCRYLYATTASVTGTGATVLVKVSY